MRYPITPSFMCLSILAHSLTALLSRSRSMGCAAHYLHLLLGLVLITGCAPDVRLGTDQPLLPPQKKPVVQALPEVSPRTSLPEVSLRPLPEVSLKPLPESSLDPPEVSPESSFNLAYYLPPALITDDTVYDQVIREPRLRAPFDAEVLLSSGADVWGKIRSGFQFPRPKSRRVRQEMKWYTQHPHYMAQVGERARRYLAHIVAELERRQMPMDLALLPIVESAFQPFAYSPAGAAGLWQFMPATGKAYGLKQNWWYEGRRDVVESTRAALDYLTKLHQRFNGDWLLAIAAYNTGEGNVARAIKHNQRHQRKTDFWSLKLPRETRAYVPRLLAIIELISDPEKYKIKLPPIPDTPYFAVVELDHQIDLALAAEAANISLDEMYMLNPAHNRWSTAPEGPQRLCIPLTAVADFSRRLSQVIPEQRRQWTRYVIQNGDSLSSIAQRYHTAITTLQRLNGLSSTFIRAGSSLVVPNTLSAKTAAEVSFSGLSKPLRRHLQRAKERSSIRAIHRVRRGENLSIIAKRYRTTVSRIASWNGLDSNAVLLPGQRLIILDLSPIQVPLQTVVANTGGGTGLLKHRIQPGDSLSRIAAKYSTTIEQLMSLNGIPRNMLLQVGKLLVVPDPAGLPLSGEIKLYPDRVHYIVQAGDSLPLIARIFNTNTASLRQWNQLSDSVSLHPGQRLLVHKAGG